MTEMMEVRIALFGAFREVGAANPLTLALPRGSTVAQLREVLLAEWQKVPGFRFQALLNRSAVGSETEILAESTVVPPEAKLALLPPVCGG